MAIRLRVLDAGPSSASNWYLSAHCLSGHAGSIALLAANAYRAAGREWKLRTTSTRYPLSAQELLGSKVQVDEADLKLVAAPEAKHHKEK